MNRFTIGKVAAAAGVGVETIRFYQKKGLIDQPPFKGSFREYPKSVVSRIQFILRAKELGFSLAEIRELLTLSDGNGDRGKVKSIASRKLASIRQQLEELRSTEVTLKNLVEQCSGEGQVHGCPIIEALVKKR